MLPSLNGLFLAAADPKMADLVGWELEPEWLTDCITGKGILFFITSAILTVYKKDFWLSFIPNLVGKEFAAPTNAVDDFEEKRLDGVRFKFILLQSAVMGQPKKFKIFQNANHSYLFMDLRII